MATPSPVATIRKTIRTTLEQLSPTRMKTALDFLWYLKEKDDEASATAEIIADKKVMRDIRAARRDWHKGITSRFTSWRSLRRHV